MATQPWPPTSSKERIANYAAYQHVYEGQHKRVFVDNPSWGYECAAGTPYIVHNYCRAATRVLAARMLGEGVKVDVSTAGESVQKFIDFVLDANDFQSIGLRAARMGLSLGDVVLKVWFDGTRIRISVVHPQNFFPTIDPIDATTFRSASIEQVLLREDDEQPLLHREIHEMRSTTQTSWIRHELYELQGSNVAGYEYDPRKDRVELVSYAPLASLKEEDDTGVPGLLLVHIPNTRFDEGAFWGTSDYDNVMAIQADINDLATRTSMLLRKFSAPLIFGPPIQTDDAEVILGEHRYFPTEPGEGAPFGVVSWDPKLTDAFQTMDRHLQAFASTVGVDVEVLRQLESGAAMSGRALKIKQHTTGTTAQEKQHLFSAGLRQVVELVTQLGRRCLPFLGWSGGAFLPVTAGQVKLGWSDGLPNDDQETAELAALRIQDGTLSRTRAIEMQDGVPTAEAAARYEEILTEPQPSGSMIPSPGAFDEEATASAAAESSDSGAEAADVREAMASENPAGRGAVD